MKVKIRPIERGDIDSCFERELDCFNYKVRFDKQNVYGRLYNLIDYGISYIAIYKKKTIGHITSFVTKGGDIYIDFLCIDKEYRRKKVGKQLLEKLEQDNPRSNIYLRTGSNNQPAIKFYLTMGYEIHEVKGDDWKYRDILMVLKRR